nr:LysR family transcriptional regulator [Lautropia sp.]
SPSYLASRGTPQSPADLTDHNCLGFGNYGNQARGWLLQVDGKLLPVRVTGNMECNDGAVLHDWALAGHGLAWRSMWEVSEDLKSGQLQTVLDEFAAPVNAIHAVFPQRRHLPLRVRMFVDYLKTTYGDPAYWRV